MALQVGPPAWWEFACEQLSEADPALGEVIARTDGPTLQGAGDIVGTIMHAIVGQQISSAAATAIRSRLSDLLAGPLDAAAMDRRSDDELRGIGLSAAKAKALRGLAAASSELRAYDWRSADAAEVRSRLLALRGVGPWTVDMVRIFALLEPDVLPLGDIGVVRAIEELHADGARLEEEALLAIGERWRPWRTCASWYLWRLRDGEAILY